MEIPKIHESEYRFCLILWEREPEGVPRMTERMDGRALRLKTLGNAVCPPQAYPIFHYIAAIETGACADICPYGEDGDCR